MHLNSIGQLWFCESIFFYETSEIEAESHEICLKNAISPQLHRYVPGPSHFTFQSTQKVSFTLVSDTI